MRDLDRILEHFFRIVSIPHCSGDAERLREYIDEFSKKMGYETICDEVGNIVARRADPTLCLQAHYDMVCTGKAPDITIVNRDGWLSADASSLGADNGIAVAMMLVLMEDAVEAEFLFTVDEEIGLIGAKNLHIPLVSKYMLNLDTEEAGEVYIGCAGGLDMCAVKHCDSVSAEGRRYIVKVDGLPGGHSGVDIDLDIPNAIIEMAKYLKKHGCSICAISGGERRNSIPVHCEAVVKCDIVLQEENFVTIRKSACDRDILEYSEDLLDTLIDFGHGVVAWDDEFEVPLSSANLAVVDTSDGKCRIEVSLRAMDDEALTALEKEYVRFFSSRGFEVSMSNRYGAWKPKKSAFSEKIKEIMTLEFGRSEYKVIHAGLECGILKSLYPDMSIVSIGPNIEFPHSNREKVDIDSIEKIFRIIRRIIRSV